MKCSWQKINVKTIEDGRYNTNGNHTTAINYLSCNVGMTPEKYLQLTKIVNKQGFKRGIVYQIVRLISRFTMKLHII